MMTLFPNFGIAVDLPEVALPATMSALSVPVPVYPPPVGGW